MAIQCLVAEKRADCYFFQCWLDNTKTVPVLNADGTPATNPDGSAQTQPDPNYVRQYSWGLDWQALGYKSEADYLAMIKQELENYYAQALALLNPPPAAAPTPLTGF